jgi:hypothetical protein
MKPEHVDRGFYTPEQQEELRRLTEKRDDTEIAELEALYRVEPPVRKSPDR